MQIRSLTLKLTLAFLLVGLTGAILIAVFVSQRTQDEFVRFIVDQRRAAIVDTLQQYYQENGTWQGVEGVFLRDLEPDFRRPPKEILVDHEGKILWSRRREHIGTQVSPNELQRGAPLEVNHQVVGWILFDDWFLDGPPPPDPQSLFLGRVSQAIIFGALGATALALVLGILLARNLTRPIRELIAATRVVAKGDLGHQVTVRSKDELGELATSFNQMSADLARASKLRRQMTADIAHDLRTPLSIILGYTEALDDGKMRGTPEIYTVMHNEAQQLSRLVDDLRTLSLADAGELKLMLQEIAPQELLKRTASAHQAQAEQQQINLEVNVAPDLPIIKVDTERMAQVLHNLISNALQYTPEGGQIVLSATADDHAIYLQVRDTGEGIAPEDLPYIFNRFYRADQSRRQQTGESGLGLAIARSLVEAHGAAISVESTPGQGSVFTLRFPSEVQ
jgi:signal transduction histidine kinase